MCRGRFRLLQGPGLLTIAVALHLQHESTTAPTRIKQGCYNTKPSFIYSFTVTALSVSGLQWIRSQSQKHWVGDFSPDGISVHRRAPCTNIHTFIHFIQLFPTEKLSVSVCLCAQYFVSGLHFLAPVQHDATIGWLVKSNFLCFSLSFLLLLLHSVDSISDRYRYSEWKNVLLF